MPNNCGGMVTHQHTPSRAPSAAHTTTPRTHSSQNTTVTQNAERSRNTTPASLHTTQPRQQLLQLQSHPRERHPSRNYADNNTTRLRATRQAPANKAKVPKHKNAQPASKRICARAAQRRRRVAVVVPRARAIPQPKPPKQQSATSITTKSAAMTTKHVVARGQQQRSSLSSSSSSSSRVVSRCKHPNLRTLTAVGLLRVPDNCAAPLVPRSPRTRQYVESTRLTTRRHRGTQPRQRRPPRPATCQTYTLTWQTPHTHDNNNYYCNTTRASTNNADDTNTRLHATSQTPANEAGVLKHENAQAASECPPKSPNIRRHRVGAVAVVVPRAPSTPNPTHQSSNHQSQTPQQSRNDNTNVASRQSLPTHNLRTLI